MSVMEHRAYIPMEERPAVNIPTVGVRAGEDIYELTEGHAIDNELDKTIDASRSTEFGKTLDELSGASSTVKEKRRKHAQAEYLRMRREIAESERPDKFEIQMYDHTFQSSQILGEGAFGQAFLVRNREEDGTLGMKGFVLKVTDMAKIEREQPEFYRIHKETFNNEVVILSALNEALKVAEDTTPEKVEKVAIPRLIKVGGFDQNNQEVAIGDGEKYYMAITEEGYDFIARAKLDWGQDLPEGEIREKLAGYFEKWKGSKEALKFIHEQGFVHRDIKPANLTTKRGSVIDFGISRPAFEREEGESYSEYLERIGGELKGDKSGSPSYMDAAMFNSPDKNVTPPGKLHAWIDMVLPRKSSDTLAFARSMLDTICILFNSKLMPHQFGPKTYSPEKLMDQKAKDYYQFLFYYLKKIKTADGKQLLPESYFRSQYIGEPGVQTDPGDPDSVFLGVQLDRVRPDLDTVYNDMRQTFLKLSKHDIDAFRASMMDLNDGYKSLANFQEFRDRLDGVEGHEPILDAELPFKFKNK